MKFTFVADRPDPNRGSYRIWVRDLCESLRTTGNDARVVGSGELGPAARDSDVIIFDKLERDQCEAVPREFRGLVGLINPPARSRYNVDFLIVGSVEEQLSLGRYEHPFLLPLIERTLHSAPQRVHRSRPTINLCYHGNTLHLSTFESLGLRDAIEAFSAHLATDGRKLRLVVISERARPRWTIGRPAIDVEFRKYDHARLPELFSDGDIGIVPNTLVQHPNAFTSAMARYFNRPAVHSSDFMLRFKNKSNYGRLLVFMQLGIPAVADLTPSHAQLLNGTDRGFLATSSQNWLSAFIQLSDPAERNRVASAARTYAAANFDPVVWAGRFADFAAALMARKIGMPPPAPVPALRG